MNDGSRPGRHGTRRASVSYVKKRRFALQNEEESGEAGCAGLRLRSIDVYARAARSHKGMNGGVLLDGAAGAGGCLRVQRAMLLGQLRVQREGTPRPVGLGQHGFERDRRYLPLAKAAEELVKLGAG